MFSKRCHRDLELKRIKNLTQKERELEKKICEQEYGFQIDSVDHQKKKCNFWKCEDGKEDWEMRLKNCLWRLNNIR